MSAKRPATVEEAASLVISFIREDNGHDMREVAYVEQGNCLAVWKDSCGHWLLLPDASEEIFQILCLLKESGDLPEKQNISPGFVNQVETTVRWLAPIRFKDAATPLIVLGDDLGLQRKILDFRNPTDIRLREDSDSRDIPVFGRLPLQAMEPLVNPSALEGTEFERFLHQILPEEETRELIRLMFGYCLSDSTAAHCAFFLVGNGANGKSVLLRILGALLPEGRVHHDTLQNLTMNRFRTADLVGKTVNISNEEESKFLAQDIFKALVSGDRVTAEVAPDPVHDLYPPG